MNEVTLALIISALSLGLAGLSLGWNIYRDIIIKPKAKITVARVILVNAFDRNTVNLKISAVNYGPGKIRLNIIRFKKTTFMQTITRKWTHGVLFHDWENPLSGQLPSSLEVGQTLDLIFPWTDDNIFSHHPTKLGICDSFGKTHWCSNSDIKKVQKQWNEAFSK